MVYVGTYTYAWTQICQWMLTYTYAHNLCVWGILYMTRFADMNIHRAYAYGEEEYQWMLARAYIYGDISISRHTYIRNRGASGVIPTYMCWYRHLCMEARGISINTDTSMHIETHIGNRNRLACTRIWNEIIYEIEPINKGSSHVYMVKIILIFMYGCI